MASQPPPESIVLQTLIGVKNTITPERLQLGELEAAVNVDIDDAGQARRRKGYSRKLTGVCHSATHKNGTTLVVKDGVLGVVGTDYTFTALATVGPERLSYVAVGETIYFSSTTASGKIVDGAVLPWGARVSVSEWLSPVLTPTDTLGAVGGKQLRAPPLASELGYYNGRIYMGVDRWLWVTELWLYDKVNPERNFIPLTAGITMIEAVDDGVYVGCEDGLYFFAGSFAEGLRMTQVSAAAVVRGSAVQIPMSRVRQQLQVNASEALVPMFLTTDGVMVGAPGGQVHNLTQGRMVFPGAVGGGALYREDFGVSSYVVAADSAGGPNANARIGDYAEAEIRRFQGG